MPKLSPIRARKLIAILEKLGFEKVRQKGSHVRMRHSDGRRTSNSYSLRRKSGNRVVKKDLTRCTYIT